MADISKLRALARPPLVDKPVSPPERERFGRFEIIRHLASGGMAEVFLAEADDKSLAAIKRLSRQPPPEPSQVEMFFDEATLAMSLRHPNIVRVLEVGERNGELYMAMQFLHGETAHSLMRTAARQHRRVPVGVALHTVLSVCAGLHYAHDCRGSNGEPLSIVHRDVSPQNIVCTYDGMVKLIDFGIAKSTQQAVQTQVGLLKGKASYMSPEHCLGTTIDRRSDIFCLGIVLYELTLGRRLYRGQNEFDVMRAIVDADVTPPSRIDPGYDLGLEAVVMRALDKNRMRRFQSAREMADALGDVIDRLGVRLEPSDLENFFSEFFGERIRAWRKAEKRGKSLGEYLATAELPASDDEIEAEVEPVLGARPSPAGQPMGSSTQLEGAYDEWAGQTTGQVAMLRRMPPTTARVTREVTLPSVRAVQVGAHQAADQTLYDDSIDAPGTSLGRLSWLMSRSPLQVPPAIAFAAVLVISVTSGMAGFSLGRTSPQSASRNSRWSAIFSGGDSPSDEPRLAVERPFAFHRVPSLPEGPSAASLIRLPPHAAFSRPPVVRAPWQTSKLKRKRRRLPFHHRYLGRLALTTLPRCSVKIDGDPVGYSPLQIELRPGPHVMRLGNNKHSIVRTLQIVIKRDKQSIMKLDLRHRDDDDK